MNWKMESPSFSADELNPALAVSPWSGHRNFAYDLTKALRPKRIVELGSHYGCSLFAFAQAIKDCRLDTELCGVDTWRGDEQAGFYTDEVFQLVEQTRSAYFSDQNIRLLRKTFLEARGDIADGSVDILHIDGLHTYEAVREDFETWLCKLAVDGVVLFHDVNPNLPYGSRQHWSEVSARYPSLEFLHSWGLGVLFPKGAAQQELIAGPIWPERRDAYTYGSEACLLRHQVSDLTRMVESRDVTISQMEAMIEERDAAIRKMDAMIRDRDLAISSQTGLIDDRDRYIKELESRLA
jgi:hypothetical protein